MKYVLPALLLFALSTAASAQRITGHFPNPNLESIYPPGGQVGGTANVRLAGRDLDDAVELHFSHRGITATREQTGDESKGKPGRFNVSIDDSVPAGTYEVRVLGKYGLSTPRAFVVGHRPELVESEPNNAWDEAQRIDLETTVNAASNSSGDLDRFRFTAEAGQRLVIDCLGESIDSPMEVVMTLRDENQNIVAVDHDTIHRDALIDFTPEVGGDYVLEVRDLVHDGSAHHLYRFTVTSGPHIDFVHPFVVASEKASPTVNVYGRNLPGGEPVEGITIDGTPIQRRRVTVDKPLMQKDTAGGRIDALARQRRGYHVTAPRDITDAVVVPLPEDLSSAGAALVTVSEFPVHLENENNDQLERAETITPPITIAGQFYPEGDRDYFQFEAKQGQVLEIDVVAQRMGIAADALLVVQQFSEEGSPSELAVVDDQSLLGYERNNGGFQNVGRFAFNSRTDDPGYRFVSPADGRYAVMVRELNHTVLGDARFTYQLAIRSPQPDFRVVATAHTPVDLAPNFRDFYPWTPVLRPGGVTRIDLQAFRYGGFEGDIRIRVEGLPPGVSYAEVAFDATEDFVPLVLVADSDAEPWAGAIKIVAEGNIDGETVTHLASPATILWQGRTQRESPVSRRMLSMPLSILESPETLRVTSTTETLKVRPGEKLKVPVQIVRGNGFAGPVMMTNIGLPRGIVTAKPVTIPAAANGGEVELTISSSAKPVVTTFCLDAKIDVPDPRAANPDKAKSVALLVSSTPIRVEIESK